MMKIKVEQYYTKWAKTVVKSDKDKFSRFPVKYHIWIINLQVTTTVHEKSTVDVENYRRQYFVVFVLRQLAIFIVWNAIYFNYIN